MMNSITEAVEAELQAIRNQYQSDKLFDGFLYGGVRDLDLAIGPLVYLLWKNKIVETIWSCSGHSASTLLEEGSAVLDGHWVYSKGNLSFKEGEGEAYSQFVQTLQKVVERYPFANINNISLEKKGVALILTMDDLGELTSSSYSSLIKKRNIPEDKARERLDCFYKIWSDLTMASIDLSKEYSLLHNV